MKIESSAAFETSHTANYRTKITAKIVSAQDVVLCKGEDMGSWPNVSEYRATAKEAVSRALIKFQQQLDNSRDAAHKSGLV